MNSSPGSVGVPPATPRSRILSRARSRFLINTAASARCTGALSTTKLFQQFFVRSERHLDTPIVSEDPFPICGCPWKLTAMLAVALVISVLGFWVPGPLYDLVKESARILGGSV